MFWPKRSDHHYQKYWGLRLTNPLASAFQRPGSKDASVRAPNFALFAGVRQEPAKQMRQREGANFCSLFNAGVTDALASGSRILLYTQRWRWSRASEMNAPASGSRIMPLFPTPTFLKHQRNGCTSVGEPISAPFSNAAPAQWITSGRPNCPTTPAP
jgi:hypothetical protein